VTFQPDGTRLVSTGKDPAVTHWAVATGQDIHRRRDHDPVTARDLTAESSARRGLAA
jgi:hypothetical protein